MLENSANPFEREEFLKMYLNVGVYLTGKDEACIRNKNKIFRMELRISYSSIILCIQKELLLPIDTGQN